MTINVGVVVPCANPAVEPEVHALLPKNFFPYVTRLPYYQDKNMKERLSNYVGDLAGSIDVIKDLNLDGVLVACTGSSYPMGLSGDKEWTDAASAQLGNPVVSAAGSVAKVLNLLNAKELVIVSSYPTWLSNELTHFWKSAGYQIAEITEIDKSGVIYDLTREEISATLRTAMSKIKKGQVLLVAGTGVPSLGPVEELVTSFDAPIVTSQIAGIWNLMTSAGYRDQIVNSGSAALNKLNMQIKEKSNS